MPPINDNPCEVLEDIARVCFRRTVAVFFGEPDRGPQQFNSASGVLIRLERPLLITAFHVVKRYLDLQADDPFLRLQIAKGSIDRVDQRLLGASEDLDLAVLDLSNFDIKLLSEHLEYHAPRHWPPRRVVRGTMVVMSGFPKAYREVQANRHAISFLSWHLRAKVDSVSDEHFACGVNTDDLILRRGPPDSEWLSSYGALSGSPVFDFREAPELVGIVHEANEPFHIIRGRHADLIARDGTLLENLN